MTATPIQAPGVLAGVLAEFDRCWPWLDAALRHGGQLQTREAIWAGIVTGQYQFWPHERAAGVTHVDTYPMGKMLQLWLVGGDLDAVLELEQASTKWAIAIGCSGTQLSGRPGWKKVLRDRGYQPGNIVLQRRFD